MKSYCIKNLTASLFKHPFLALVFIDNHIVKYDSKKYTKSDIEGLLY